VRQQFPQLRAPRTGSTSCQRTSTQAPDQHKHGDQQPPRRSCRSRTTLTAVQRSSTRPVAPLLHPNVGRHHRRHHGRTQPSLASPSPPSSRSYTTTGDVAGLGAATAEGLQPSCAWHRWGARDCSRGPLCTWVEGSSRFLGSTGWPYIPGPGRVAAEWRSRKTALPRRGSQRLVATDRIAASTYVA
jgi:hypothetical protein